MRPSDESSSSSSHRRRGHLPPLAPRNAQPSSRGERSGSSSGRPPRLSHRSRAGCWTCRGRKVKCDEIHPRCGPCTRLNRDCDWDHRWNFSDATPNTQSKYTNVTTQGNAVWDPQARSSPSNSPVPRYDDMPAFSVLQTDDERERKAETQRPGTFGVVVTPDSFSDLPEYAATASPTSRRMSVQSQTSLGGRTSSLSRTSTRQDPNTVVLERFEDVSPGAGSPFSIAPPDRRPSLPESMYYLAITSPPSSLQRSATAPAAHSSAPGHALVSRFRHYIVQRLCQPLAPESSPGVVVPGSTRDTFEIEAQRFAPLHHAICAISSLNLAYRGESTLEVAIEHYHSALSAGTAQDDLLSDGGFLRHFLLLMYDICMPMSDDSNMWAEHLGHLQRFAGAGNPQLGRESRGFIIWRACELDLAACLLGNGHCDFVRHVLQHNLLPPLEQQIPVGDPAAPYAPHEAPVFPAVLHLRRSVLICTAQLAQLAQTLRADAAAARRPLSPGASARFHAAVAQAQTELRAAWTQSYPDFLPPESPDAGRGLPHRVRFVFDQAFLLYQAATIYSRTSMFPTQQHRPPNPDTQPDTERRALAILALAARTLETDPDLRARHVVFPLFLAGVASVQADAKVRALELAAAFEARGGIGRNAARTRALLKAVCEAQRRVFEAGGSVGEVEWLAVARERRLGVVNCGL